MRCRGKNTIQAVLFCLIPVAFFVSGCMKNKTTVSSDMSSKETVSEIYSSGIPDSEENYFLEEISEAEKNRIPKDSEVYIFFTDVIRLANEEFERQTELTNPNYSYHFLFTKPVDGRQGVAWARGDYYISGNQTISHYDRNWDLVATCVKPFQDIEERVNHISDIDIYQGEIYAGVEYFQYGGYAYNFMIAVYDAETFQLKRTYPIARYSGLREISGITVDYDTSSIWVSSWVNERTGQFVYRYDLKTGDYIERKHFTNPVPYIQGVSYHDGHLYFAADDGDAAIGEPDHLYSCTVDLSLMEFTLVEERTFDYVMYQGEMEGLDFDPQHNRLLLCYNRGVLIPDGYLFELEPETDKKGNIIPWTEESYYEAQEKARGKYKENYHGVFAYELNPLE